MGRFRHDFTQEILTHCAEFDRKDGADKFPWYHTDLNRRVAEVLKVNLLNLFYLVGSLKF